MNSKTERFLNQYKVLETLVSAHYDLPNSTSAMGYLLRRPEFQGMRSDLEYCREVRNLLSHNPKVGGHYAVEPSDEMLRLLDRVIDRIRDPQRAKHIMIPVQKVLCKSMEDLVRPTMLEMEEHVYTNIPILRSGVVVGVFSENTLLRYLLDDACVCIGRDLKFRDLSRYLPMDQHRAETYRFIRRDTPAATVEQIFAEATKKRERIGLLFVTENGKPEEKLLGIISAWDAAGID